MNLNCCSNCCVLISHSTNNNLPSTVYFAEGIFSFLPARVILNRSRQMSDTSEYEKHIKGKIAQNKNKLVELGLTPISKLDNGKKSKYATRSATFSFKLSLNNLRMISLFNKHRFQGLVSICRSCINLFNREPKDKHRTVAQHKKFTNPTTPRRSSDRLHGSKSESLRGSQDNKKSRREFIILDPSTTCPPEQTIQHYHLKCTYQYY